MAADWLVVGLGNPGAEYAHTRHNCGADAAALLAARHGGALKREKRVKVLTDVVRVGDVRVLLAFPQTYYNESGIAAGWLLRREGLDAERLVVVHDELDLPTGRIKVKFAGGLAGNKGLASVKAHVGTDAFCRVRIGIGKPPGRQAGTGHVLRRPGKHERTELDISIEEAADAVETIVSDGVDAAMLRFNTRTEPE